MRGFAHGIELCCCVILCSALLSPRRFVTADNGKKLMTDHTMLWTQDACLYHSAANPTWVL